MEAVLERFLRYVSLDTQSNEASLSCPSTDGQRTLGNMLVAEMLEMGIADAHMDENGYVYGTVPGDSRLPTIGLIAHMDTAPACSGANVKPRVVEYQGEDLCLNKDMGLFLKASEHASLKNHLGKHLVVTDGTTLLGADDKAGIAEILTAAEWLLKSKTVHATLKIGFTPDEEIGRGADRFSVSKFGADYAYTVDGGALGEIEYENFNAASAKLTFRGISIHPGAAKDKLLNSQLVAMEYNSLLPIQQRPEYTQGYEGFIMLESISGEIEQTITHYIIRDHDMEKFQKKKELMEQAVAFINTKYGKGTATLSITDSYYNMKEKIQPFMFVVERAKNAMKQAGMQPITVPIRGGTDGARLSYMGLPCPNLCTGGENYHGRFEYIPVEDMETCVQMLVNICIMAE